MVRIQMGQNLQCRIHHLDDAFTGTLLRDAEYIWQLYPYI